jgi:hypothetical protein
VRYLERLIGWLCILGALVAVAGCVGPARTYDDYRLKAVSTVETTRSAIGTAHLAIDVARRGRTFTPYATVVVSEAEDDASSAQATFDSVQPPDARSDQLRDEVDQLVSDATDELAALRIAGRRGDLDGFAAHAEAVDRVANGLDHFIETHS